ncbi:MAG: U32 family peptidase, partial [Clostridia bacterium]|nr:U32 family peptidase [Clostridia bacterium]
MAALKAAVDCGANAVYLGYKAFGARASAVNFDAETLSEAVSYAHLYHARIHVTVNTLIKENELEAVREALATIRDCGADAVIVQDLGVAAMVRDEFPELALHASTQMGLSNASDAAFARDFGFTRVVLAREYSLEDIRKVVSAGIETEVFAHGALCSGVSGRCLMSSMAGGRSGNRGRCAQPCRLQLRMGEHKGALLSLRDLCTYEHLPLFVEAGVCSLKVEGRLKSPEYVAVVASVYRKAL